MTRHSTPDSRHSTFVTRRSSLGRLKFALRIAALAAIAANARISRAAETVLDELSLATDTNAVIDVPAGDVTVLARLTGNRGTITKTGEGTLKVVMMRNTKARFDIQGGKLLFDSQAPRAFDEAFFHVDASRADTLVTESLNGTNFVVRWNDVRGNGRYATNTAYTAWWRPDPENRRAFISDVTQNGLPVVDFGGMLFAGYTNAEGRILGYGASMEFNERCPAAREVYEVISDTPDIATITVDYPVFYDKIPAVSFISSSTGTAGNKRENLGTLPYPHIFYDNSSFRGWSQGWVYVDGTRHARNAYGIAGKFSAGAGFHVLGFTSRTNDDYSVSVNAFARNYNSSFGGQRLAEYLVFTNRLSDADRYHLQTYLVEKWKRKPPTYAISALTVADGASVEFAPGVTLKVANVADGADLSLSDGEMEVNPLLNPDAYFHVDAADASSLVLEERNGTNFVRRWGDALANGVYATNYFGTFSYRNNPENRFPYISAETLSGRPVIDFGSILVPSYTNAAGQGIGYGGCLQWSAQLTAGAREVFTVVRDTEDVKTVAYVVGSDIYHGQSYVCDPEGMHGFRHCLVKNAYPYISYDNSYNSSIKSGTTLVDGTVRGFKNWRPTEGFHVFNLQLANSSILPEYFAYTRAKGGDNTKRSFGGTRIAEFLVFPIPLEEGARESIYAALRTKWFGEANAVTAVRNLTVGEGASMAFKWRDLAVSGTLSVGGTLAADAVSAANLDVPASGGVVAGSLSVVNGATVTAALHPDGTVCGLRATALALSGGGTVVLSADSVRRARVGDYPLLTADETFSGSLSGWSVDASALSSSSARLILARDGVYVRVVSPGTRFMVR